MRASITPVDLQAHRDFLIKCQFKTSCLKQALYNYETDFLPSLSKNDTIPTIEVAWIWHCHKLAPKQYADYCTKTYGKILSSSNNFATGLSKQFEQELPENWVSEIDYDLLEASERQKTFLWHILPEKYEDEEVLKSCIQQKEHTKTIILYPGIF